MKKLFFTLVALTLALPAHVANGAVRIEQAGGWLESAYITWSADEAATGYHVYVSPAQSEDWSRLDDPLVRQYPDGYRADAVGLRAGTYQLRIVPLAEGVEQSDEAVVSEPLTVSAHDRSGFAHVGMNDGLGAYRNDGTLKPGARVVYVWADNAKTVSADVITSSKGATTRASGFQDLVYLYQKGYDTTPLCIRVIGTVRAVDMDSFGSSSEGLQIKGKGSYSDMPITIEGIGDDACLHGFGMLVRGCHGVEIRNLGFLWVMDDALSIDTGNSNIWVHHNDFFYGRPGSDSDQAKGDGTVDIKGQSTDITVSYNHFWDSGKSSLGGMKSETTDCRHTYHHNWFDHSDSRHPRIRTMFFHVYNNYFDGVSKYGVGVTMGGSALVEANAFRNCKYPMLSSRQGTDAEGSGTFSGETGGVIKAYANEIKGEAAVRYYDGQQNDGRWDAVLATDRDETVTATAYAGGTAYNNAADLAARTAYIEQHIDAAADVPAIVKGPLGAGRMGHGDISWAFDNARQDENYGVIAALSSAIQSYQSTLVGFADGTRIASGGGQTRLVGGDGQGIAPEVNDAYVPTWAGGGSLPTADTETYIGTTDANGQIGYFWCTADHADEVERYMEQGIISLDAGSKFQTSAAVTSGDGATVYSDKVGSLQLAKQTGSVTLYGAAGLTSVRFYLVRTGSFKGAVLTSDDGSNFTQIDTYSGNKGIKELSLSLPEGCHYLQLTNEATGSLHVQGIMATQAKGQPVSLTRAAHDDLDDASTFDLMGRTSSGLRPGLNVVRGKVLFVK